jgi:hypothetical protein
MNDTRGEFRDAREIDRRVAAWLRFWLQFGVLGVLAVLGAFWASGGTEPGDYACGMALVIAAVVLAFWRLKDFFDGRSTGWGDFMLVDTMFGLAIAIPLFTIIGLAGLLTAAAWQAGALYNAGLGLFGASAIIILLDIRRVYDRLDRRGH